MVVGCASQLKPTPCTIINVDVAECVPSDPREKPYDKDIRDMLGYIAFSPDDYGDIIKTLKDLVRKMEDLKYE